MDLVAPLTDTMVAREYHLGLPSTHAATIQVGLVSKLIHTVHIIVDRYLKAWILHLILVEIIMVLLSSIETGIRGWIPHVILLVCSEPRLVEISRLGRNELRVHHTWLWLHRVHLWVSILKPIAHWTLIVIHHLTIVIDWELTLSNIVWIIELRRELLLLHPTKLLVRDIRVELIHIEARLVLSLINVFITLLLCLQLGQLLFKISIILHLPCSPSLHLL